MWHTILESNLINFLIVVAILVFICIKLNVNAKIGNLQKAVIDSVEKSSAKKEDAHKALNEIQEKINHLNDDIADIEKNAERNIKSIERRISKEIVQKKKDIDNNATRIINLENKNFKAKLSDILSDASINLVKKNVIEQLSNNKELHDKYINEAIEGIDKVNLWK